MLKTAAARKIKLDDREFILPNPIGEGEMNLGEYIVEFADALGEAWIDIHGVGIHTAKTPAGLYVGVRSVCKALGIDGGGQEMHMIIDPRLRLELVNFAHPEEETLEALEICTMCHVDHLQGWLHAIDARELPSLSAERLLCALCDDLADAVKAYWDGEDTLL